MKTPLSLLLAVTLLLTLIAQAQDTEQILTKRAQLEGLDITMSLKKRRPTPQQANWPHEEVTLTSTTVRTNGRGIDQMLRENHITPNVEAYGIVYALNPQVKELSDIKIPELRLPSVQGGNSLIAIFNRGFTVDLIVDKELKERFAKNIAKVRVAKQTVADLADEKFQNGAVKEAVIASLDRISSTLELINNRLFPASGPPMPTEVLRQLNAGAELLSGLLNSKAESTATIGKKDQEQISAVEKDVLTKGRAYAESAALGAPDRWPEVLVTVKTLRAGQEIPNLRIYYVPQALKGIDGETQSFGVLSSPARHSLAEADYCFWAAKDPDKAAISNEQCVEVRLNRQNEVHLTVNP